MKPGDRLVIPSESKDNSWTAWLFLEANFMAKEDSERSEA